MTSVIKICSARRALGSQSRGAAVRGETGGMCGISCRTLAFLAVDAAAELFWARPSPLSLAGDGTGGCSAAGVSDSGREAGVSGESGARTGCLLCSGVATATGGVTDSPRLKLTLMAGVEGFSGDGDVLMVTPIFPDSFDRTSAFLFVPVASASLCVISG